MAVARELIEDAALGERDAQRQIYELIVHRIYRTVFRIVGRTDVDDVTQNFFVQLFSSLHSFRFESEFLTWAHRLAVNAALHHLRVLKRTSTRQISDVPRIPESRHADPDLKELVDVALSRLDAELRLILDLREFQELAYSQIAAVMDIPEGTVGSRLNRARRELKSQLLALGWEE